MLRKFCDYGLDHWGSDTSVGSTPTNTQLLPDVFINRLFTGRFDNTGSESDQAVSTGMDELSVSVRELCTCLRVISQRDPL